MSYLQSELFFEMDIFNEMVGPVRKIDLNDFAAVFLSHKVNRLPSENSTLMGFFWEAFLPIFKDWNPNLL